MISITVHIQMQIQTHTNTQVGSNTQATPLFTYKPFINFWLKFFDTRKETQFLKVFRDHTMLTTPKYSAHLVVQSQFLNTMVGTQLQLSAYMAQSQLPTVSFSKSSNSQDHCFWAWRNSHSSPISYLRFIMKIVIVISFVHERKLYQLTIHLNS